MTALGYLLVGSVSLSSARKAARAAKAETPGTDRTKTSSALTERYLGHFGASARKSTTKKTASRPIKKSAAKKVSVSKQTRAHVAKKSTSKNPLGSAKRR